MKARKKRILKVIIYSILLVSYGLGFIVIFNLKAVLGIGYYYEDKNYTVNMDNGSYGINLEIWARHRSQNEHNFGYSITAFSAGEVDLVGIVNLFYQVMTSSTLKRYGDLNFSTPRLSYSGDGVTLLYRGDNFTLSGYADIAINVNSINEMHRITFVIGTLITLDGEDINYEWGNISTWLNVIYLAFTIIPLTLLYRSIKKIRFSMWYSEDLKSRDDVFFNILSKKKKYEED